LVNNSKAALLNVFVDEIKVIWKKMGLKVFGYVKNIVCKIVSRIGAASKDEITKIMVSYFPKLGPSLSLM